MTTPVIIEAALNGVTSKERNPHVPCTPSEIADDALRCLAAGAAIIHTHVDEVTADGARAAARYREGWRPILAARPDAILYPTVGLGETIEERYAHVPPLAELMRMGLVDPGSVNLGAAGDDGLPGPAEFVYVNSYADVRHEIALCERHRLGPSIAIFEPGFLRTALAYHRAGRLPAGALVKLYFGGEHGYLGGGAGATFGLPPTRVSLDAYLAMLDGVALPWSVAVVGGDLLASDLPRLALASGGHLRVGLEDYAGARTPTNEELVRAAAELAREMGRPVASCAEAARILSLPR